VEEGKGKVRLGADPRPVGPHEERHDEADVAARRRAHALRRPELLDVGEAVEGDREAQAALVEERGERGRQPRAGGGRRRGVEAAERGAQRALVPRAVERDLDERRAVAEVRVRARVEAPRLEVGARGGGGGGRRAARLGRRRRAAGRVAARARGPRRVRVEDREREALGFR
jgi:hypothetical protein